MFIFDSKNEFELHVDDHIHKKDAWCKEKCLMNTVIELVCAMEDSEM